MKFHICTPISVSLIIPHFSTLFNMQSPKIGLCYIDIPLSSVSSISGSVKHDRYSLTESASSIYSALVGILAYHSIPVYIMPEVHIHHRTADSCRFPHILELDTLRIQLAFVSVDQRNLQAVVFLCIATGDKVQLYGNIIGEPAHTRSAEKFWISDISAVFHDFPKLLFKKIHVHHSLKIICKARTSGFWSDVYDAPRCCVKRSVNDENEPS